AAVLRGITIDRSLPVAEILSAPASVTSSDRAVFTIGGLNVVSYSARVDGAAFGPVTPVTNPVEVTGLADGAHVIEVRGISVDSVTQDTPTRFEWTVDSTAPVVSLSQPATPSGSDSVTVTVSGDDVVSYRYRIDGRDFSERASVVVPITESGLGDGIHSIEALGIDALGNEQSVPTTVTWVVDRTAPEDDEVVIDGDPGTVTVDDDTEITVGGPGIVEYFYELDDNERQGPFPVGTPIVLTGLAPGEHVLRIFAVDAAGNIQDPPRVIRWTIDPTAVVAVVSEPPAVTNADSVTLTITGTGVVEYRAIVTPPSGSPEPEIGPVAVDTPLDVDISAAEGTYLVQVFGEDSSGGVQAISSDVTFVADRTAPTALLVNSPSSTTSQTFVAVSVAGDGVVSYRYRLDGGALQGPFERSVPITASGLDDGEHRLEVFATDAAGNAQASATEVEWSVVTGVAVAVLSGVPPALTDERGALIQVSGDGVVAYRYRLDGGPLLGDFDVATPISLSGLSNGQHSVDVFAVNAFGTVQSSPTRASWTID
ncbi:MAG: hypothetical protein AAFQ82_21775, partial [Myxococcota bacterium]